MTELVACFDESGKFQDHEVVSFCGFVDTKQAFSEFERNWRYWLRKRGLDYLHFKEVDRYIEPLSPREPALGLKARHNAIAPFVRTLRYKLRLAVGISIDVAGFGKAPPKIREGLGSDPHYLAFVKSILVMLNHSSIREYSITLICDDDKEKAAIAAHFLETMKTKDDRVKRIEICFRDDQEFPGLQAADLLAYLSRRESCKRFLGKPYAFDRLYGDLRTVESGQRLRFRGGFWGETSFEELYQRLRARDDARYLLD